MEVTIELQGQYQVESFETILNEKSTLLNIAEIIQEAQYYEQFNLSELFCLEVKGQNKFISGRQTSIKACLIQYKIDIRVLTFYRGLDGQKKMNKGVVLDQNIRVESNTNQINQQVASPEEDIWKVQKNTQQAGGVIIGGGNISASQHLKNLERNINQQNQKVNFDAPNQLETVQSYSNQPIVQQNSIINSQPNQIGQAQVNLQQGTYFGKNQQQFNQQQSAQAVNQLKIQEQQIREPQNQYQPSNISNQGGYEIGGDVTQSQYIRQLQQNSQSNIERQHQQQIDPLLTMQSAQSQQSSSIKIKDMVDIQQSQQSQNTNQISSKIVVRQQIQQTQQDNTQPVDHLLQRQQPQQQQQYNNNQPTDPHSSNQQPHLTQQINNQQSDLFSRQQVYSTQNTQSMNNQSVDSFSSRQQVEQALSTQQNSNQQINPLFQRQQAQSLYQNNNQPSDHLFIRQTQQQQQQQQQLNHQYVESQLTKQYTQQPLENNIQLDESLFSRKTVQQISQTSTSKDNKTNISLNPQVQPEQSIQKLYQFLLHMNPSQEKSLIEFLQEKQIQYKYTQN
ncbi:unnamed protein product (macronuclear) [Paramecium tetraurelia]|uniref:Uncharacterized protein n=1 Tax=Paramecium tetraurelia TaxID=5888 RepID=A0CFS2_PARTE|nr:uncharacterized protein GSPATT00038080001 [Paramecium tetraurelia]CAK69639.1 unnamed protein product [Paramecium tetraurelia]|eukprot:XP_001437036.1 hypothetical protein (macronuclear) [Paramecium tetraurelia strain d4-2]